MRDERSVGSAVAVVGAVLGVVMSASAYLGLAGVTDVVAPPKRQAASTARAGFLSSYGAKAKSQNDLERPVTDRSGDAAFLILLGVLALGSGLAVSVLPADVRGVFLFPCVGLALPGLVAGVATVMLGVLFK